TFDYFSHKHLPLKSTYFFSAFILCGLFNILSEFFTLFTITNLDTIPLWLNRFSHQLYIGSLDLIIIMLFLYIDLKARSQKKYSKAQIIIRIIPIVITFFLILFGDLKYYVEEDGFYSYGFMANTIYTFLVIYLVIIFIILLKNYKIFSKNELIMIIFALLSWATISVIQFFNPTWLLSSLGIVMMTELLYLSFENSFKFLANKEGIVFTKNSFELITKEYMEKNNVFYLVKLSINNASSIETLVGLEEADDLKEAYFSQLASKLNGTCFNYNDKTLIILSKTSDIYNNLNNDEIFEYKKEKYKLSIKKKLIECDETIKSYDELINILETDITSIKALKDNKNYNIDFNEIYYIEAVDNQSFLYTKDTFYEIKEKLYQLENILPDYFIRCSKSMICNTKEILSVEPDKNSRLIATLTNEETIVITRQYTKDIKSKINI
ncbi:MAG: LytTR family DNA-binding domain-containing protein, partial [Anaeroplasmataceae bacterium]